MLIAGQEHYVTFKVNVMGTSIEPMVRLVLGGSPLSSSFSFPASKSIDTWSAKIAVPESLPAGDYDLKVEVVLNNRLFTPLVKKVAVARQEEAQPVQHVQAVEPEQQAVATVPPEVEQPATEVPSAASSSLEKQPGENPAAVEPVVSPSPAVKPPAKKFSFSFEDVKVKPAEKPAVSIADEIKAKPKKTLENLQTAAEKQPKKVFAPVITPLPKPSDVQPSNIEVKFGDVVKIAEKKEAALPKKQKKVEPTPVIEVKHELPITLSKDEIIYE